MWNKYFLTNNNFMYVLQFSLWCFWYKEVIKHYIFDILCWQSNINSIECTVKIEQERKLNIFQKSKWMETFWHVTWQLSFVNRDNKYILISFKIIANFEIAKLIKPFVNKYYSWGLGRREFENKSPMKSLSDENYFVLPTKEDICIKLAT